MRFTGGFTICGLICICSSSLQAAETAPAEIGEVLVTAAREGVATNGYRHTGGQLGPVGNVQLRETPYSVNVTSGKLIENRVSHDPTDALKTVPTVVPLMSASGYSSMHRVMVRGFTAADQSDLRDGLTDRSFTLQPMENVDRIEVMNGMSGFLYGFSALGGTVNYISKKPSDKAMAEFTAGQYNKGIAFGQVDAGGPLVNGLGGRFNAYRESGDTYIDGGKQSRSLASGALRYRVTPATTINANFYQQMLDAKGIATYFDNSSIAYRIPEAFDPTVQYGQNWTYNRSEKSVYSAGIESQLSDIFTLRAAYLRGDMWRQYRYVSAKLTDLSGHYTESLVDTPRQDEITDSAYALLDARFDTAAVEHNLTFGYTHWGFTFWRGADLTRSLGTSGIASPASYAPNAYSGEVDRDTPTAAHNILLGDRMVINRDISILAGVNYARSETEYHGAYIPPATPLPAGYSGPTSSKSRTTGEYVTPSAGLSWSFQPEITAYASYMQGIAPGGTAPASAKNAGEILDASASDQFEIGLKSTIGRSFDLSTALFRINKINEYTDPGDKIYKQDGREVHQGVEVLGSGRVLEGWTVLGGFTLMSAEIDKAANNTKTEGETPVNVPEAGARLYTEYQLPGINSIPGTVTLTAGANYHGKRPVDIPNTQYIPEVTLFDAGVRYQPTARLTFNFNVSNLADEHYWQYYRSGDGLLLGDPRLFAFSAKYAF